MSAIVDFLDGSGPDGAGCLIAQVQAFNAAELERHHDFIQWLFPLPEPSASVPGSPVLTQDDVTAIKASAAAQTNLGKSAVVMAAFYHQTKRWLAARDHNHLRITRIIKSLRLLVGDDLADRFRAGIRARVRSTGVEIDVVTLHYWDEA